eukprot:14979519-Alexandrium_andersonii.AAC.1
MMRARARTAEPTGPKANWGWPRRGRGTRREGRQGANSATGTAGGGTRAAPRPRPTTGARARRT